MTTTPAGPGLAIESSVRRRILDELVGLGPGDCDGVRPGRSAAEIGELLGLHVTTARFHLDRLIEAGVVEGFREARGTVGRPRKLYAARFEALPAGRANRPYRELAEILKDLWGQAQRGEAVDAAAAGYAWALEHPFGVDAGPRARTVGAWLVKVEQLTQVVATWGHTCTITLLDGGRSVQVGLGDCPFAAVAHRQPRLVSELHRGILTGVLVRLGEPEVGVEVAAIDERDCCTATLTTRTTLTTVVGARR